MTNETKSAIKDITEAQRDFLSVCEKLGWGKIELIVKNGEPATSRIIEWTHQHKR